MTKSKRVPFPQANSIDLIYNILFDIGENGLSKFGVSKKYGLTDRQGAYYLDALLFLGLVEKINTKYYLTQMGISVRLSAADDSKKVFVKMVLNHPIIGELFSIYQMVPEKEKCLPALASEIYNKCGLGTNTAARRASTIKAWFDEISNNKN